nr:hypothetical protein [uncultured Campylobacter sp.]
MNSFVSRPQKLKCPKCGKTTFSVAGCVSNFEICLKCGTLMKSYAMGLMDKIINSFKT